MRDAGIFFIVFALGGFITAFINDNIHDKREYKKPLIPIIKTETINGKSDTTYIYKF